ncbi:MAG: glycosyltransferase family 2 protein [Candidatus Omnitrophica bacterium]|nr:glycosyltransferase family 2 protein [Candidatus Omnitrophota bacterium]
MTSIVVLTFNSINFIKSCLDSVFKQDCNDFEVIVVDNGSKDGTVDFIRTNYPSVELIENKENLGACKARNQGIEASNGEWILTLDCDISLEPSFLKRLTSLAAGLDSRVGVLQPKILKNDRKTIFSCGIFLSGIRRFYDLGKDKIDNHKFDSPKYVFGSCSAASFYRKSMLEDLREDTGYFDERFFFLVEDVDLAWRAQQRGWKAYYCPEAICYHSGNSSGSTPAERRYLCFRNRFLSISKNENLFGKIKLIPVLFFYDLPRVMLFFLRGEVKLGREVPK